MKPPSAPRIEERRAAEFAAEMQERARAWIPEWDTTDRGKDFGLALLEIAARFNSEVAERLDVAGEKMRRGFLDWLGDRGQAARPSRMPVVFKLAETAVEPVLAEAPVRMQADVGGKPVVFETEKDVRLIPGQLAIVVGVDADEDAFYLPPPGLSSLEALEPLPTEWRLKSFTSAETNKLQLDPETGLTPEMLIEAGGKQYRIINVENEIVTIEPRLDVDLEAETTVSKVTSFAPFGKGTQNRQEHALYLGHMDLLNIESDATIEIVGAESLITGITWQYWGKVDKKDEVGWQDLDFDQERQKNVTDAVVLKKPKGAVEPLQINGTNSRWIRAYTKTVKFDAKPFTHDGLGIKVNACGCKVSDPCPDNKAQLSVAAEGMANTTPLVLDSVFLPLGREPRQFDAFYLGSEEAFSKKGASAKLTFEMADRTFSTLAAVREGKFANYLIDSATYTVIAGIAKDSSLHLLLLGRDGVVSPFSDRAQLRPNGSVSLDLQPRWRVPVWPEDSSLNAGFLVGTSAGNAIWIWHEHPSVATSSEWIEFGKLPAGDIDPKTVVDGLVYLAGPLGGLFALFGSKLFMSEWKTVSSSPAWKEVPTKKSDGIVINLKSIVPVYTKNASGVLVTQDAEGMIGISDESDEKKLYHIAASGLCTPISDTVFKDLDPDIRPVSIRVDPMTRYDAAVIASTPTDPPKLIASKGIGPHEKIDLDAKTEVLGNLEGLLSIGSNNSDTFDLVATIKDSSGVGFTTWAPFEADPDLRLLFDSRVPASPVADAGAPLAASGFIVIPAARTEILTSKYDPTRRLRKSNNVQIGIVVPHLVPAPSYSDLVVRYRNDGTPERTRIRRLDPTANPQIFNLEKDGEVLYKIRSNFSTAKKDLDIYHLSNKLNGSISTNPNTNEKELTLALTDKATIEGEWLVIHLRFYKVKSLSNRIATLEFSGTTPVPPNGLCQYVRPIHTGGRVAPFMKLDTADGKSGDWDAELLDRTRLVFPGQDPIKQRAKAFENDPINIKRPKWVALREEFKNPIQTPTKFIVDGAFDEWRRNASDTSSSPELSWEYSNGKAWSKLHVKRDQTENLKTSGILEFEVPTGIAPSDWAGKTNFWIRARLVGGDYGKEKITTETTNGNPTVQTIKRSLDGIRPPSVLKLTIQFAICEAVQPTFVLAQDSGTVRDQSDANRTPGAIVEAFVPLARMLGRLMNATAEVASVVALPDDSTDCGCAKKPAAKPTAPVDPCEEDPNQTASNEKSGDAERLAKGRAIFVGLNATPSEAPINLLFRVEKEHNHSGFAPMDVEALAADRFVPIVVDDATRALGETGLLSMTFAVPPTRSELFGNENLSWLQLRPKTGSQGGPGNKWTPELRGAYLNAVWASATETLTRELVGSSSGEPNMKLTLARPPVLQGTLELRVREPLGEEERDALRKNDPNSVLSLVEGLPGDWVLWKQVIDPDDQPANERVYSLDEANGEIRFGNGLRGKIPPIGRDSIVAFAYQRTEPPVPGSDVVPGNTIVPRTALNMISPVETVEAVVAADQAAGGAPPESDERVLRFGFARVRHRERAVTAADIEDLALQSSPDIVQARVFIRCGYIQLVVVMKGKDPVPNAAQIRELRRYLLSAAPAILNPDALRIEGPPIRRLRIKLTLRIETLSQAGELGQWVKERLVRFFDTASGGGDKDGWLLGADPSEQDIAFALIDAPHLESIGDVKLVEVVDGRSERDWPVSLKANEIVMLADDAFRIVFETAEVTV